MEAALTVNTIREELRKRNLNPIGTKAILTQRLDQALKAEGLNLYEFVKSLSSVSKPNTNPKTKIEPSIDQNTDKPSTCNGTKNEKNDVVKPSPTAPSVPQKLENTGASSETYKKPVSDTCKISEKSTDIKTAGDFKLDSYTCDLNLNVDEKSYTAKPMVHGGFSLMWAGVKSNYGIKRGKAFFEVKVLKQLPVGNLDSFVGGATHVLRVGWSSLKSGLALGEDPSSFGYGGTGKKSCNNKFLDYGCKFGEGDTIGAFLEFSVSQFIISFSVNGVYQGECYRMPSSSLPTEGLFPHIYVKNVEFSVNFGQNHQSAWFPPTFGNPPTWKILNETKFEDRVPGHLPPKSKSECQVIMMIGLPGCGKTYLADKLCRDNGNLQYNVLGTNLILDKMKVTGLGRKRNYKNRWESLIEKSTKCLNHLISLAGNRCRNYILDQTNVYSSAQRRKLNSFAGFKRKAIVVVPTDEEFRRRVSKREKEEGKDIPDHAVLQMKANFEIPKPKSLDSSSLFDEVTFPELQRVEAEKLVKQYNVEGRSKNQQPEKRARLDNTRNNNNNVRGPGNQARGGLKVANYYQSPLSKNSQVPMTNLKNLSNRGDESMRLSRNVQRGDRVIPSDFPASIDRRMKGHPYSIEDRPLQPATYNSFGSTVMRTTGRPLQQDESTYSFYNNYMSERNRIPDDQEFRDIVRKPMLEMTRASRPEPEIDYRPARPFYKKPEQPNFSEPINRDGLKRTYMKDGESNSFVKNSNFDMFADKFDRIRPRSSSLDRNYGAGDEPYGSNRLSSYSSQFDRNYSDLNANRESLVSSNKRGRFEIPDSNRPQETLDIGVRKRYEDVRQPTQASYFGMPTFPEYRTPNLPFDKESSSDYKKYQPVIDYPESRGNRIERVPSRENTEFKLPNFDRNFPKPKCTQEAYPYSKSYKSTVVESSNIAPGPVQEFSLFDRDKSAPSNISPYKYSRQSSQSALSSQKSFGYDFEKQSSNFPSALMRPSNNSESRFEQRGQYTTDFAGSMKSPYPDSRFYQSAGAPVYDSESPKPTSYRTIGRDVDNARDFSQPSSFYSGSGSIGQKRQFPSVGQYGF